MSRLVQIGALFCICAIGFLFLNRAAQPDATASMSRSAKLAGSVSFGETLRPEWRQPEAQTVILALHSYSPAYGKTKLAREALAKAFGSGFLLKEEFLDTKRLPVEESFLQTAPWLRWKSLRLGRPAIVMTFDDNALEFALRFREDLFRDAPIVFAGVNSKNRLVQALAQPGVSGVGEEYSIGATIRLAKSLNPSPLRRIVAVVDRSVTSRELHRQLAQIAPSFPTLDIETLDLSEATFSVTAKKLRDDRASDTAYLFLLGFRDAVGEIKSHEEILEFLNQHGGRPVYALDEVSVRAGAVGGVILSSSERAEQATDMAKRLLLGARIDQGERLISGANFAAVNEPVALKHGLQLSRLPNASRIFFARPGFWQRNLSVLLLACAAMVIGLLSLASILAFKARVQKRLKRINQVLMQRNRELSEAKQLIEHQSEHDWLTGLPNRRFGERRLKELSGESGEGLYALLAIDVDRFKQINDTLGHPAGDALLRAVAERLRKNAPEKGFVARIGGDEFMAFGGFSDEASLHQFCAELQTDLRGTVDCLGHELKLSVSCGVAMCLSGRFEPSKLSQQADVALGRAKIAGRDRFVFFTDAMLVSFLSKQTLAADIERGVRAGEFEPFFQPQICANSGSVVAIEALARWRHPEKGLLGPDAFLSVSEEIGLVSQIDRQILSASCIHMRRLRDLGVAPPQLSVNVSARRLLENQFMHEVSSADLGGARLAIELLETVFFDQVETALSDVVSRLRQRGVLVEIDDFGTGHASIVGLLAVCPDRLKIARELTQNIDHCGVGVELLRSLVNIGKALNIGVTAEGVERRTQAEILTSLGCDVLQGYYFARPMSASDLEAFLQDRSRLEAKNAADAHQNEAVAAATL